MTSSRRLNHSLRTAAFAAILVGTACISLHLARVAGNLGNRAQACAMTVSAGDLFQTTPGSYAATSGADLATIRNMPFVRTR